MQIPTRARSLYYCTGKNSCSIRFYKNINGLKPPQRLAHQRCSKCMHECFSRLETCITPMALSLPCVSGFSHFCYSFPCTSCLHVSAPVVSERQQFYEMVIKTYYSQPLRKTHLSHPFCSLAP